MKEPDKPGGWTSPPQLAARPGSTPRRNATIGGSIFGVVAVVVLIGWVIHEKRQQSERRAEAEAESKATQEMWDDQMRECTLDTIPSGVPIYKFMGANELYLGETPITRMKLEFEHKQWIDERFEARPPGKPPITLSVPDCPDTPILLLAEEPL